MKNEMILVYEDGTPAGIDTASGGYPFRAAALRQVNFWTKADDRELYSRMFSHLRPATLRWTIEEGA